jgi:UPF0176 protein
MKQKAAKHLHNRVNRRELKAKLRESNEARTTLSFYKYARIDDPPAFRDHLYQLFHSLGILGRVYVAHEGINAQISAPDDRMADVKAAFADIPLFHHMRLNIAVEDHAKSFFALIIKVREKIVADGIDDPAFDPAQYGTHLGAAEWNRMAEQPDTIIVDMRNHYESEVGHFEHAITPQVATFREELPYVAELLADNKNKNILMYCTGGIRCEKASAYMRYRGYNNVFQLEGGIIEYARQVKAQGLDNKFRGKNFVFDERLGERISHEVIAQCHQCGAPCDDHTNCLNSFCHILFIQCPECQARFEGCCSVECRDFMHLPENERQLQGARMTFNGSKFGKGVYRAFHATQQTPLNTHT